jgi:hypothetical protein
MSPWSDPAFAGPCGPAGLRTCRKAGFLCARKRRVAHAVAPSKMELSGQDRRALRSEAGRREAAGLLSYLQVPEDPARDPGYKTAALELQRVLATDELVRVRTGQKKKKLAKEVGESIAQMVGGLVCQTIGHTVLVYKNAPSTQKLRSGLGRIRLPSRQKTEDKPIGEATPRVAEPE